MNPIARQLRLVLVSALLLLAVLLALWLAATAGCHIYVAPTVYQQNCDQPATAPDVDGRDVLDNVVEMTNGPPEKAERQ